MIRLYAAWYADEDDGRTVVSQLCTPPAPVCVRLPAVQYQYGKSKIGAGRLHWWIENLFLVDSCKRTPVTIVFAMWMLPKCTLGGF